jgi:hypothetical protein
MEYYIQQFKLKVFQFLPNNLRKNAQYLVIITSDFKPIGGTISINENLLSEYSKYKWKKPVLRCDLNMGIDDIVLNSDERSCKMILNKACKSGNKYKIICNKFNLKYNVYQWV